jgi:dienelactone hydrolase
VVLLHGCGGVSHQLTRWARWLAGRGYLALVLDSFGPRGVPGNCAPDSPDDMPTTARFDDAMGALTYLQSRPDVVPGRIAAIGFSQGGGYAMSVINGPSIERARGRGVRLPATGYAAAIAVYPGGCEHYANEQVLRPLLVLIGAADDWTPAPRCEAMVSALNGRGANASIVLYPGAYHYFDVEGLALTVLPDVGNDSKPGGRGATVGYDAAAAADARRRIDAFLSRYLAG